MDGRMKPLMDQKVIGTLAYLSVYLSVYLSLALFVCLSVFRFICLSIVLSFDRSIYLASYLSNYLVNHSICLPIYRQAWERNYSARLNCYLKIEINWKTTTLSARLLQFLNLTTSKTKQFWETETSSMFEGDKWIVKCKADGLVPMRFAIFPSNVSEALRLPAKSEGHTKCCTCHAKSS